MGLAWGQVFGSLRMSACGFMETMQTDVICGILMKPATILGSTPYSGAVTIFCGYFQVNFVVRKLKLIVVLNTGSISQVYSSSYSSADLWYYNISSGNWRYVKGSTTAAAGVEPLNPGDPASDLFYPVCLLSQPNFLFMIVIST